MWKIKFFGLILGQDLKNRAAHPHQEFPGVPPLGTNQIPLSQMSLSFTCLILAYLRKTLQEWNKIYYVRNFCNLIGLEQWYFSWIWNTYIWQRAKKIVSDSLGLVDFASGQAIFVLNLPDGQVLFFGEIQITKGFLSILLIKKGLGLVELTCGLVHASCSLPEWQAVKLTFFAPCMKITNLLRVVV